MDRELKPSGFRWRNSELGHGFRRSRIVRRSGQHPRQSRSPISLLYPTEVCLREGYMGTAGPIAGISADRSQIALPEQLARRTGLVAAFLTLGANYQPSRRPGVWDNEASIITTILPHIGHRGRVTYCIIRAFSWTRSTKMGSSGTTNRENWAWIATLWEWWLRLLSIVSSTPTLIPPLKTWPLPAHHGRFSSGSSYLWSITSAICPGPRLLTAKVGEGH